MIGRPSNTAHRLSVLRRRKRVRGWLPLEERFEMKRLEKYEKQNAARRERYANDAEYRLRTRDRILAWQRARREG